MELKPFLERKARARNFLCFRWKSERESGESWGTYLPEPETRSECFWRNQNLAPVLLPLSESQDGGSTCFGSSVSHFFEKCLPLQATGIVAFKIVLTYLSWNIEVKQSNWEYTTMPLRPLAASEELSLFLDLKEQALDEWGYFFSSHAFMDDWFWLGVLLLRFSSSVLIFCAVFARCV